MISPWDEISGRRNPLAHNFIAVARCTGKLASIR
jgi:hypothetical protein